MQITEAICTGNSRYRANQRLTPRGVVLHSIGTPQPDARVLRDYWQRNGSQYVVHYMVDDTKILHTMPDNLKCWHVGSPGNGKYIGIEMGEPSQIKYTSGARFTVSDLDAAQRYAAAAYRNAVQLIAYLCKKYGWEPSSAVWTHSEITKRKMSNTDHVDPQHLWDGLGMGLDLARLRSDVKAAMGGTAATTWSDYYPTIRKGDTGDAVKKMQRHLMQAGYNFSPWGADGIFGDYTDSIVRAFQARFGLEADGICGPRTWAALRGEVPKPSTGRLVRIKAQSGLNVRSGPGTGYGVVKTLAYGGAYTIVEEQDGWGLLKAYAAGRDGWICLAYTETKT